MYASSNHNVDDAKDKMPLITCDCGAVILLIPDLKAMGIAIEEHASLHKNKISDPEAAEAEAERIRTMLVQQVISKAAEHSSKSRK